MRILRRVCCGSLFVVLVGCSDIDVLKSSYKNGLDGKFEPDQLNSAVELQDKIMYRIEVYNGRKEGDDWKPSDQFYYNVTLTGLSFIDEQCDAYMRELYLLDKVRDRTKSVITSTGVITQAILGALPTSKASVTIVGQAFGLSDAMVDSFANSYLFQNHSAEVTSLVETMQAEYRKAVSDNQKKPDTKITSRPQAYTAIRGYFRLCMPQSIEARISNTLQNLEADTKKPGGSAGGILVTLKSKK